MKKIGLGILMVLLSYSFVFAEFTSNASPITVDVNTTGYDNITFPYNSRNISVYNYDTDSYIFIDFHSDTNTSDRASCFILGPSNDITLYDYVVEGISIIKDNGIYGPVNTASPISVLVTY